MLNSMRFPEADISITDHWLFVNIKETDSKRNARYMGAESSGQKHQYL